MKLSFFIISNYFFFFNFPFLIKFFLKQPTFFLPIQQFLKYFYVLKPIYVFHLKKISLNNYCLLKQFTASYQLSSIQLHQKFLFHFFSHYYFIYRVLIFSKKMDLNVHFNLLYFFSLYHSHFQFANYFIFFQN